MDSWADPSNNNTISPSGSVVSHHPWVHFLRCPECGFTTLNLHKFETHFPCALRSDPPKYFTYVCSVCQAVSTNREIMEDHKEIYHKKTKVNIIECCDTVKKSSHVTFVNGDAQIINGNNSTDETSPNSTSDSSQSCKGIPCPFCKALCQTSDDLTTHIQFLHFAMSPLAAAAAGSRMTPGHPFPNPGTLGFGDMSWSSPPMTNPPCPICGAVFRNFRQLEMHMTTLHSFPRMQPSPSVSGESTGIKRSASPCSSDGIKEPIDKVPKSEPFVPPLSSGTMSVMSVRQPVKPPRLQPSTTQQGSGNSRDLSSDNSTITNGLVHNTMRKTKSDMKVITRFIQQNRGDNREIHLISEEELDEHLQEFVAQARKKDGHEYEPESLKAFIHSMERYLRVYNYSSSVLRDACFVGTRTALNNRLQELRAHSRTTAVPKNLSVEHAVQLFGSGLLGADNPQALLNILWFFNRVHFCIRGTHRHKSLTLGQFQILTSQDGSEYLQFAQHPNSDERRYYLPSSNAYAELPLDLLDVFKIYNNMRPVEARQPYHPFYLAPDPSWEQGGAWFKHYGAGVHVLAKIPRLLGIKMSASSGEIDSESMTGSPQESVHNIRDETDDTDDGLTAVDMSIASSTESY